MLRPTGGVADRPIGRLRTGVGGAVPLIDGEAGKASAIGEVDRDQQVTLTPVPGEGAAAACCEHDRALEELEIHVAVSVVDQSLSAEVQLRMPIDPGVAHGVDVAEVGLGGDGTGAEAVGRDRIAVLPAVQRGGIVGPTGRRVS